MAKKNNDKKTKPAGRKTVEVLTHDEASRKNIPTAEPEKDAQHPSSCPAISPSRKEKVIHYSLSRKAKLAGRVTVLLTRRSAVTYPVVGFEPAFPGGNAACTESRLKPATAARTVARSVALDPVCPTG